MVTMFVCDHNSRPNPFPPLLLILSDTLVDRKSARLAGAAWQGPLQGPLAVMLAIAFIYVYIS